MGSDQKQQFSLYSAPVIEPDNYSSAKNFTYFTPWLFIFTLIWLAGYATIFPDPIGLAASNWPLIIIVGVFGAFIGNATAIGGGIVFIPVLMFAYQVDPVSALKLAFVTQAVGMTSGASGWLRRGEVPLRLLKWTVPALIIGTMMSTFLIHPQPMLVKGLFGPIAFLTGLLTLITLDRKGGRTELPAHARTSIVLVSFIGGMITGWVAIGEGEIIAAFCMLAYGLNANRAIGPGRGIAVVKLLVTGFDSCLLLRRRTLGVGGIHDAWRTLGRAAGTLSRAMDFPTYNEKGFRLHRVARWLDDYPTGELCDVFSVKDL